MLVYSRYHEILFRRSEVKVDHSFEMYLWKNFFSFVSRNKKIWIVRSRRFFSLNGINFYSILIIYNIFFIIVLFT